MSNQLYPHIAALPFSSNVFDQLQNRP